MIYSMTGFGKASFTLKDVKYSVEIKTLNSKQADIFVRTPQLMKAFEIPIRKLAVEQLKRGKIELNIFALKHEETSEFSINKKLLEKYKSQIEGLDLSSNDLLGTLLRLPNVVVASENSFEEGDEEVIYQAVQLACEDVVSFREDEGRSLEKDLKLRISNIRSHKDEVEILAPKRVERIRARMMDNLNALKGEIELNSERLEQELIFYIEKLDVTEEFVRLDAHCDYFVEIMNDTDALVGKKLNFISQELGREINTLGSKANDAGIQKFVVRMKDELEKIKEQVNNVL